MKLKISDIEKKLNKTIRKDCISLGWDVSESNTGICVLKTDKNNIEIFILDNIITSSKDDIKHRLDYYEMSIDKFKQKLPVKKEWRVCIVEQPYLGMNPFCYEALARFSTLVYQAFKKEVDYIDFIPAISARSKIGFNLKKEIETQNIKPEKITRGKNKGKDKKINNKIVVYGYLKRVFELEIKENNQADAFILALVGLL